VVHLPVFVRAARPCSKAKDSNKDIASTMKGHFQRG
jgi:hypothetical protein